VSRLVHSGCASVPGETEAGGAGPIRILCDEIGFPFDPRLERPDLLIAFVAELVEAVARQHDMAVQLEPYSGKPTPEASLVVLALSRAMLTAHKPRAYAVAVHDAAHELNPEDAYPTNHTIDQLSSCASAIRFGLESPCKSRHAASAANHVWKQTYGISLFDGDSPAWGREWARSKLQAAIISLMTRPHHPITAGDEGEAGVHTK